MLRRSCITRSCRPLSLLCPVLDPQIGFSYTTGNTALQGVSEPHGYGVFLLRWHSVNRCLGEANPARTAEVRIRCGTGLAPKSRRGGGGFGRDPLFFGGGTHSPVEVASSPDAKLTPAGGSPYPCQPSPRLLPMMETHDRPSRKQRGRVASNGRLQSGISATSCSTIASLFVAASSKSPPVASITLFRASRASVFRPA